MCVSLPDPPPPPKKKKIEIFSNVSWSQDIGTVLSTHGNSPSTLLYRLQALEAILMPLENANTSSGTETTGKCFLRFKSTRKNIRFLFCGCAIEFCVRCEPRVPVEWGDATASGSDAESGDQEAVRPKGPNPAGLCRGGFQNRPFPPQCRTHQVTNFGHMFFWGRLVFDVMGVLCLTARVRW